MKTVELLQGKWLGHPLHPAIVHVPVGAWFVACVLDFVVRFGNGSAGLAQLAQYCVGAGLLMTLLAVPTGLAEWAAIKKEKPAWKLALYHMLLNAAAAAVWTVNFFQRVNARDTAAPITNAILLTSIAGIVLLLAGAYLGKRLVFEHGIAVARLSKQKWRDIAQRGGANVPKA